MFNSQNEKSVNTEDYSSNTVARANRAAFLVDAENYFRAVAEAIREARHSVLIVGWDIDSRLRLVRDGSDDATLSERLNALIDERPDVHVHILIWDYPMAYSMDREPLQLISFARKTRQNVHFHLDSELPIGSSHHQKIVVVDNAVAFCGGMDLSSGRWDTMDHLPKDERRKTPAGEPYTPYHDVQMVVDGEAAAALGDIARKRWLWAKGECLKAPDTVDHDPWPASVKPAMNDQDFSVLLTLPSYKEREEVRDMERMYRQEIERAEKTIYIENQYFTSEPIQEALSDQLEREDGPEVVIVLPHTPTGLVERLVMEPLQSKTLDRLHEADAHGRLGIYCPFSDEDNTIPVKVHAKVMVIDDEFVTIGSANLNNRSMGLDTECNLALRNPDVSDAIRLFRRTLMAHHLGISVDELEQTETSGMSMLRTLEHFRNKTNRMLPESVTRNGPPLPVDPEMAQPLDPKRPGALDTLMDELTGNDDSKRSYSGFIKLGLVLAGFIAMALAWRYTPLSQYADTAALLEWTSKVRALPFSPVFAVIGFIVGGFVMFPVTIMIILTAGIFDPVPALLTSLAGCMLSALIIYGAGTVLGRESVKKVTGTRINTISRQLGKYGLTSVVIVRVLPVAPFTIINLVAGASHISLRNFVLGTLLGMGPGILGMTLFGGQLINALRDPGPVTIGVLILITLLVGGLGMLLKKRLRGINGGETADDDT
ncbi:VTT domain-containing protein [Salidesulfovibrio brasiliensis]